MYKIMVMKWNCKHSPDCFVGNFDQHAFRISVYTFCFLFVFKVLIKRITTMINDLCYEYTSLKGQSVRKHFLH